MLKRNSKSILDTGKVRKAFRFTVEVQYRLRKMSAARNQTMGLFLHNLICEWWEVESQATGITIQEVEEATDWGYRANSYQEPNQVRHICQFRMEPFVVRRLEAMSKLHKVSQASICETLINDEYNRKIYA